jgi:urease accessory protein
MADDAALLALLQLTDSGFPSGAYTLSHGLETLVAEDWVTGPDALGEAIATLLLDRAAEADLPVLLAAHAVATMATASAEGGGGAIDRLAALDRTLETVKLAREEREGSMRVGRRLLVEAARLFPETAVARYAAAVRATGGPPGHTAVAQGLTYAAAGVSARTAALAAGAALASGTVTAAMRLGLIGHGDAQRLLLAAHPVIAAAVDRAEICDPFDLRPSAPMLDIALARHERADVRTFAS